MSIIYGYVAAIVTVKMSIIYGYVAAMKHVLMKNQHGVYVLQRQNLVSE